MAKYVSRFVRAYTIFNASKHNISRLIGLSSTYSRDYSSALLVCNKNKTETFSFVTPYINFDDAMEDTKKLQKELVSRGVNIDVKDLKQMWEMYKSIRASKTQIEEKFEETQVKLNALTAKKDITTEEEIEKRKLHVQLKAMKEELKGVKNVFEDMKENVLLKILQLPNEVDKRTPIQAPIVLKRVNSLNERSSQKSNHIDIGKELGILEYKNPMQYYLCNEGALFELGVLNYAGKILSANEMIRVAGSDFSRSVVVEGSGLNHEDPSDAFILDTHCDVDKGTSNRMHLVGGASVISFLAMHTKQLINPNCLPVGYFSTGRQYTPFRPGSIPIGLFTVCQSSAVVAFMVIKDRCSQEYRDQFDKLINTVSTLYDNICDHYQIVMRPASDLRPCETMRVSFELWSSFSKQYIEVGHISLYGDYLSKRLLIAYQTPTGREFPSLISGTVLSVPRLLACLLEQDPEKFVIPQKIQEHIPI